VRALGWRRGARVPALAPRRCSVGMRVGACCCASAVRAHSVVLGPPRRAVVLRPVEQQPRQRVLHNVRDELLHGGRSGAMRRGARRR